jgi:hypothetical protein
MDAATPHLPILKLNAEANNTLQELIQNGAGKDPSEVRTSHGCLADDVLPTTVDTFCTERVAMR